MTLHCSQSTRLLTPHSVTEGGLGACCVLGCERLPVGQKAQLARQSQRHRQGRDKGACSHLQAGGRPSIPSPLHHSSV